MARNKPKSVEAKNKSFQIQSQQAENNVAASTEENTNQKGYPPNRPSTG